MVGTLMDEQIDSLIENEKKWDTTTSDIHQITFRKKEII